MNKRDWALVALLCASVSFVSPPVVAETAPTPATAAPAAVLGSVGIGVRDLEAATRFYVAALGMRELRRFELGYISEVVLGFPDGGGANIVLMHWPADSNHRYDSNDEKLVFYVEDPTAVLERVKANGGSIQRAAAPLDLLNGRVVGLGRDLDNYIIEVLGR